MTLENQTPARKQSRHVTFSPVLLLAFVFITLMGCASSGSAYVPKQADGALAVVNKSDNSVSVIDLNSKRIVNTLPTGQGPHELVLSPDLRWAVSTDFVGGNSLSVFDMQAQTLARTIELSALPGLHGIRFLKDNEHVIFTSGKAQKVGIANVISGEVVTSINTDQATTHMLALSADEATAYATNIRANSISVIDVAKRTKTKDIATEAMPEAINYRKSAHELWYGANQDGKLVVIDPDTEEVLASWDGFTFPYRVLFNHDETVAIVPDFRAHNVRFFDTNTKQELATLALETQAGPQGIVLHPSKDIAYLSLNLKNKVVAIDIAKQVIIEEYPTGNNPDGLVFIQAK
ncbi:YncE family protein [Glaciecola siphonariae]|uniref:YncE family protein n=1 Tax=Glaciecola siphonariae TaxID=521012 RepID=A0ABV9LSQ1_9ALTE